MLPVPYASTHARVRHAFTMIEVVVTLIILGVLTGLAVVSWTAFVHTSNKDAAGSLLDRVTVTEQSFSQDWGGYTAWPGDLPDLGTDVTLLNGTPSASPDQVSVVVGSAGTLGLAVRVDADTCVYRTVFPLSAGGGSSTPTVAPPADCDGAQALPQGESALAQTGPIRTSQL